jgi:transcription elongation factor S-II
MYYNPDTTVSIETIREVHIENVKAMFKRHDIDIGEELAQVIEYEYYLRNQENINRYKNLMRSLMYNLNSNETLRNAIISGELLPEYLACMDFARREQEIVKQTYKVNKKDIKSPKYYTEKEGCAVDWSDAAIYCDNMPLLKCRKCKSTRCDFNQVQTRGADEPMTVFAVCLDCGVRWRK